MADTKYPTNRFQIPVPLLLNTVPIFVQYAINFDKVKKKMILHFLVFAPFGKPIINHYRFYFLAFVMFNNFFFCTIFFKFYLTLVDCMYAERHFSIESAVLTSLRK